MQSRLHLLLQLTAQLFLSLFEIKLGHKTNYCMCARGDATISQDSYWLNQYCVNVCELALKSYKREIHINLPQITASSFVFGQVALMYETLNVHLQPLLYLPNQPWMLPRTWQLQKWQRPPWCWSGNAPWPNWTPSDWFMYLPTATGPRKWSQPALSLTSWGALHPACCTPSASSLREAAGPVHPPPSPHPQVSTPKNTSSKAMSQAKRWWCLDVIECLKCLRGSSGRRGKILWHKCQEVCSWHLFQHEKTDISDILLCIIT